jgi:hypothetical protein
MFTTIISLVTKFLPSILPFIGKVFPDSAKIQELRAQRELKDAEAFAQGRIPPSYLIQYVLIGFFALGGTTVMLSVFFPELARGGSDLMQSLRDLVGIGASITEGAAQ